MNQCSMWEADEQCEPEMVSGSAGRNSIVHLALSETINNASPSTVNVLRSMQTPLTRGLFCLLRSSFGEVGSQHFFTLNNGKRLLWFFPLGAGPASSCMCYSEPGLFNSSVQKLKKLKPTLHNSAPMAST